MSNIAFCVPITAFAVVGALIDEGILFDDCASLSGPRPRRSSRAPCSRKHRCAAWPAPAASGAERPWLPSSRLVDRLLVIADQLPKAVAQRGSDDAEALDDERAPPGSARQLLVVADCIELLAGPAQQDKADQVTTVRLQNPRVETLDAAVLLQPGPESLVVAEHLGGLLLAAPNDNSPADEQPGFCHGVLPVVSERQH